MKKVILLSGKKQEPTYLDYDNDFTVVSSGGTVVKTTLATGQDAWTISATANRQYSWIHYNPLEAGDYTFTFTCEDVTGLGRPIVMFSGVSGAFIYDHELVGGEGTINFNIGTDTQVYLRVGVGTDTGDTGTFTIGKMLLIKN